MMLPLPEATRISVMPAGRRKGTGAVYAIQFETTAEVYLASFYLGGG
jgi:hypothetical protein